MRRALRRRPELEREQAVTAIDALVRSTQEATSAIVATAIAKEQGAVAAIRYRIAHGNLKKMFEDLGPAAAEWQRTLENAAAAQEVLTQKQAKDAASEAIIPSRVKATKEYDDALRGLQRRLEEGEITQAEYNKAVKIAEGNLKDATRAIDDMSVFAEEAARNMQDALAEFLFDPFEDGIEGMLKGFADTLRKMAAEIVAANLADYFNFEDIFKGGGIFGGGGGFPWDERPPGAGGTFGSGPQAGGAIGLAPLDITAQRIPEAGAVLGGAAESTAAATAMATAITTAGTAAATAFTAAGTTAATALTAAGTTVAAAITTAGTAAAAAIGAAATAGGAGAGISTILEGGFNFSGAGFERGGYVAPGQVALVGESTSRQAAPELLVPGRASPTAALQALQVPTAGRIAGASATGREAPELIRAGPAGITVVPLRSELERREARGVRAAT